MTVKRYEIYIDTAKQELNYESKLVAHFINPADPKNKNLLSILNNENIYFRLVEEITVNSGNILVKELFERNNVNLNHFFYVYRNYPKVKIFKLKIVLEKDLPDNTFILKENQNPFVEALKNLTLHRSKDFFNIIEIITPELLTYFKKSNSKTVLHQNILVGQPTSNQNIIDINSIKYRLYLSDRLLVERIFPEGLRIDKSLVETVYLDIDNTVELRLESKEPLLFAKITVDNKTFYPNSTEFILEP